ncbi:MAG: hypothetical protein JSS30_08005 [Verrucomicrobia bacterium]|nr:hypothetical protein [Verrucomicrobiota bacterium]
MLSPNRLGNPDRPLELFPVNPLRQQLRDAPAGNYDCSYDADRQDQRITFTHWNPVDEAAIPYLKPDAAGNAPLTKGDGTPIPLEEGDWLIPVILRNQEKQEMRLMLPSNLIGDCRAHDTVELKYGPKIFSLTFEEDFRRRVLMVETDTYSKVWDKLGNYPMPSVKRAEAREKHLKESIPQLITEMNRAEHRFVFNKEKERFEKSEQPVVDGIDFNRTKVITLDTPLREFSPPRVNRNHILCDLFTRVDKVAMAVCKGRLIFWQHSDHKHLDPHIAEITVFPKDVFTIIPLNEKTITEAEFLANLNKAQFPLKVYFEMKLEN